MSVLVLTDICNLNCDYCFYSTVLSQKKDEMIKKGLLNKDSIYFNIDEAKSIANRLIDSQSVIDINKKSIVITWWEPTLHPEFKEIMQYFFRKWFSIHLLTNFAFPVDWEIAKFLKKHQHYFRFLVNFNEIENQKVASLTKANLINFDYEHIKIGINLYHQNYYFQDVIEILKNTKNIHTIRLWLPNAQVDEGINMWVIKGLKNIWQFEESDLDLYKKDLFEQDIESINQTWQGIKYWLLDPKIYSYYKNVLWNELIKFINLLKENNLEDRVDFYIDCWFDYKILPPEVLWFMIQRLHYKNPCSIPNGVCMQIGGTIQQCYSIGNYWNFADVDMNIKNYSIRELNNYYLLSSQLLQHWLLNQIDELKFEMCRWNNLRFFKQLFTKWTFNNWEFVLKDYAISNKGNEKEGYKLKDVIEMSKRYVKEYKNTKKITYLIRGLQLFEFCLTHWYFQEAKNNLKEIESFLIYQKTEWYAERINFYSLLLWFVSEIIEAHSKKEKEKIAHIREKYEYQLQELSKILRDSYWELLPEHLIKLHWIVKIIVQKWDYLS